MTLLRRTSAVLVACLLAASTAAAQGAPTAQTKPIDRANLDTTCAPCTNFYQFANGGWLKRNPIPPAYSSWGSFNELADRNTENLRLVLDEAAKNRATATDPTMRKVGDFYAACMDSAAIEKAGMTPIEGDLQKIRAISSTADVKNYLIQQHARGHNLVFGFGSTQDAKNSSEVIGGIGQGGLGLPDRDYYFRTDARSAALRDAYVKHIANDLVLVGEPGRRRGPPARSTSPACRPGTPS